MKPVEYQNILAVDHLEKGYNYISSKGEEVSCPVLEKSRPVMGGSKCHRGQTA